MSVGRKFEADSAGIFGPHIDPNTGDWVKEDGLDTVIRLLIGTDARAEEYEVSREIDRRGSIIDEHSVQDGYSFGSKIWLKSQSRSTQKDLNDTVEYARSALSVLIPDFFEAITIDPSINSAGYKLDIKLKKYDNTTYNVLYSIVNNTGK